MASPDVPDCFAVRRLNPFLGVAEVVDIGTARAISVDGYSWQIQIRAEPPGKRWGSLGRRSVQKKFFRFGKWTEAGGLVRAPVNPELNIREMLGTAEDLPEVLKKVSGKVPFELEDNVELWLLDHDEAPLALLASVVREELVKCVKVEKWWATIPVESGFHSTALEARGCSNESDGRSRGHAECIERQVMDAAAGYRWLVRDQSGRGRNLAGEKNPLQGESIVENDRFPEFTLRNDWDSEQGTAAVDDWITWSAPRLLTLQNLDDASRETLEQAARANAMLVEEQFRLYPRVINNGLMDSARVEARIRRSSAD